MARLAAVCRSADYPFERRQIPLVVDDNLTVGGTLEIGIGNRLTCDTIY